MICFASALFGGIVAAQSAEAGIIVDTVPVGNPGNTADTRYSSPGYGSVSYEFNIGKYEVTAGQYTAFLNAVAGVDTYALYSAGMSLTDVGSGISRSGGGTMGNPYTYSVASSHVNRPVTYVSWGDSARFANWLHNNQPTGAQGSSTTERGAYTLDGAVSYAALMAVNRNSNWKWAITSEDEWYKAAYHKNDGVTGNYWDYPTSSSFVPGRDLNDISGNNANYYNGGNVAYPIQPPFYTTVAGEFQNSGSEYGTFDQGGNVFEWNESVFGTVRCWRGGSFSDGDGSMHASWRDRNDPTDEHYRFGFRVSEVPEPTSMALLAFGGIGMIVRRRGLRKRTGA